MTIELEALELALRITKQPVLVRNARRARLPDGVSQVLKLAIGDKDALRIAAEEKNLTDEQLREAAEFFVEQILFYHRASSYRVFGVETNASNQEIRQHMALVMKWLHPDIHTSSISTASVDRSVFINRATDAWEDLKSEDRRKEYDERLSRGSTLLQRSGSVGSRHSQRAKKLKRGMNGCGNRSLSSIQRTPTRRPFLRRLIHFLAR